MNILKGKRVLVTGASGFIGHHLCERLFDIGAVIGMSEHVTRVDAPGDEVYYCDLNVRDEVYSMVDSFEPDYVFHLASQAIVKLGNNLPYDTINTNVMGSTNLLDALREYNSTKKLHRVIVASTDKVYGRHRFLPYDESFSLAGVQQIYETSKNCEDILSQAYAHSYGLPIAITRFGNVYGPGDRNMTRLIPGVITDYCHNVSPVIRSNGQQYRDYVYISDVVDGYIKLAEKNILVDNPAIYNFGNGYGSRVMDIVAMIADEFPNAPLPEIEYGAKDEIEKQYLDSTKARKDLDWKPEVRLKDGIHETIEWYKSVCGYGEKNDQPH